MANEPEKKKEKGNNEKAMTKARLLKKHTVSDLSKTACFFMKVFTELFLKSDRVLFYLLASSIATATATAIWNDGYGYLSCFDVFANIQSKLFAE